MLKLRLSRVLSLFSIILLDACGGKENEIEVQSIALSQPSAEMEGVQGGGEGYIRDEELNEGRGLSGIHIFKVYASSRAPILGPAILDSRQ